MKSDKNLIISVLGLGVMGEAIVAGLVRNGLVVPENIRGSDPRRERIEEMEKNFNITPHVENEKAIQGANVIIISVKPQRLNGVLEGLKGKIDPNALVLSIVAGASISQISTGTNHAIIVRAMPNTPAQIGKGITVWTKSAQVNEKQMDYARQILGAMGEEVFVDFEEYLDMATALSGSGPAYVFLFMEAMIDAGVHLGFPRRISEKLVLETVRGSVEYYDLKSAHPAQLRNEVTSSGGTSAAALYYLEKAGFRTAISRAIWAAYERSQELGKGKPGETPK
jgi:pyrroline-5-carboxylate reductase